MKKILLAVAALIYFAISVQATAYLHDCAVIVTGCATDQHPAEETNFPCEDPKQCKLATRHKVGEASLKAPRLLSFLSPGVLEEHRLRAKAANISVHPKAWRSSHVSEVSLFILHRVFRL